MCRLCRYGFNLGMAAPEGLEDGVDALSLDFKQIVYRQKQLGFNSIRCEDAASPSTPLVKATDFDVKL